MRIQSSETEFTHSHRLKYNEQHVSMSFERPSSNNRNNSTQNIPFNNRASTPAFSVEISTFALEQLSYSKKTMSDNEETLSEVISTNIKMSLLKALVESFSGKKIDIGKFNTDSEQTDIGIPSSNFPTNPESQSNTVFTYTGTLIQEYEISSTQIEASLTDDQGRQIDISLSVTMERSYEFSMEQFTLEAQQKMKDPLVINFNGDAVQLSSQRTTFDLDASGYNDLIPQLSSNSAYIALDKNQDGIINDGSELFGAMSGDGFRELAQYDEDNNGYIDEGDSIFSSLLAYSPSHGIHDTLHNLGVGALSLQSIESPFRITDHNNNTLGQVRSTGFYIDTNGNAGSLQQIDLTV